MKTVGIVIFSLLLALLPLMALATEQAKSMAPPISQPLVTEGAMAVQLATALGISSTSDEVVAESSLGDIGISPRNGWIADYPVTPDIVGELQQAVAAAADGGKLPIGRDEALKRFGETIAASDLTLRTYASGESEPAEPLSCDTYPNPAMINDAYSSEGPPIITYYCPPPDYYYLYDWVPYPFWWTDFWFPGFFVLRDFDRHEFRRHHFAHFSNHFNDRDRRRMFRIDPVDRFHGRTFAGIGAKSAHTHNFISTGVPHSPRAIFNSPRGRYVPEGRTFTRSGPSGASAFSGGSRGSFGSGSGPHSGFSSGGAWHGGYSGGAVSHGGFSGGGAVSHGGFSGGGGVSHGGYSGGGGGSHGGFSGGGGFHGGGGRR